jgi:hypothetical protein
VLFEVLISIHSETFNSLNIHSVTFNSLNIHSIQDGLPCSVPQCPLVLVFLIPFLGVPALPVLLIKLYLNKIGIFMYFRYESLRVAFIDVVESGGKGKKPTYYSKLCKVDRSDPTQRDQVLA